MQIPSHLPRKLTITMWDFSWYTMTMPGEPYHDLGARFAEAVQRGYNTIRICAMPYLLFGGGRKREGKLAFSSLGGGIGQRTRWYNCRGGAVLDGHDHLLQLFAEAKRHECYIILSSWEYQQSPSFLASRETFDELLAIPPTKRFMAIAEAMSSLIEYVKEAGYGDRIAYAELHNEIEYGRLAQLAIDNGIDAGKVSHLIRYMKPYIEEAITYLREQHPDILISSCHAMIQPYSKHYVAENTQVGHYHMYINGVLQELIDATGYADESKPFPNELVRSLLREDAPAFEDYRLPPGEEWRLHGNPVGLRLLYLHDWCDPVKWDLYLYERYGAHKQAMLQKVDERYSDLADWAEDRGVPVVIGEGYVGYTPLYAQFEEGPVGKFIAEYAIQAGVRRGFWGMVLCSNAAPHHPFWADVEWQRKWNQYILQS